MNMRPNPTLKRASELDDEPEPEPPVAVGGMIVTSDPRKYDISSRECYRDKVVGTNPRGLEDLCYCHWFRYTHRT